MLLGTRYLAKYFQHTLYNVLIYESYTLNGNKYCYKNTQSKDRITHSTSKFTYAMG